MRYPHPVLHMFTVYDNGPDFVPAQCRFTIRDVPITGGPVVPGPVICAAPTLDLVRRGVPDYAGCCLTRSPEDHPTIVETWL